VKTNITLIGMPGAGKSTVGIILAKNLGLGFIDTDVLIQINQQDTLQNILDQQGYLALRKIEEQEILKLNVQRHVIATGGSAAYSEPAMEHLGSLSTLVYLDVSLPELRKRITNFTTRGIAKAPQQTFEDVFAERQRLYSRYADVVVSGDAIGQEELARKVDCYIGEI
jgi:shikimate kinase